MAFAQVFPPLGQLIFQQMNYDTPSTDTTGFFSLLSGEKAPRFHKRFNINAVMAFSCDGAYFEAR
jgi:hypothetical protein